jgi:hypothetical protein
VLPLQARAVLASIRPIDAVVAAFKSGEGVPYADYGEDLHEAQAAFTRRIIFLERSIARVARQVRLLEGVGCMDGLRRAGWAGR